MLLLSPFGGVIADRTSKRLVLQMGQSFSIVIAVVMAALLFAGILEFWHLFAASVAQGLMMALVMPSRQAFLPEVVGLKRLMNAIPASDGGHEPDADPRPGAGGFMIDWIGAGSVYAVMSFMYAMSVIMLFRVKSMTPEEQAEAAVGAVGGGRGRRGDAGPSRWCDLGAEGRFRLHLPRPHGPRHPVVRVPRIDAGHADPDAAAGAMRPRCSGTRARRLASSRSGWASARSVARSCSRRCGCDRRRGLLLAGSSLLMGVAMLAFSATTLFIAGFVGLLVIGIGSAGRQALSQVLVQEYVEDAYRGRVMSLFMMQFSLMSVGTFIVSIYMEAVGPQFAIASLGGLLIAATLTYLALVPTFRRLA